MVLVEESDVALRDRREVELLRQQRKRPEALPV